ncbi:MAG: hypothetical protein P8X52_03135, partial [Limibacillus sp.]
MARETGAKITITDDVETAVNECDFLYTDVWLSMGEPEDAWEERIRMLLPFQVNRKIINLTKKESKVRQSVKKPLFLLVLLL